MKKGFALVGLFIIAAIIGFCQEAEAQTVVEAGPTFLSAELSDGAALFMTERFKDEKYALGMGYVSEQRVLPTWERNQGLPAIDVRENLIVFAQRRITFPRFDRAAGCSKCLAIGLGAGYANATTRWNGSHFVAALSIEITPQKNWGLTFRHFSNAGSATPNMGQDMLLVTYKFK